GTGKQGALKGMTVAGKTGTAQIVNLKAGGYYKNRFITSFCAFFPTNTPRYLIMILVNDPKGPRGEHTGGSVCAPIFRKVSERILGLKPELWALSGYNNEEETTHVEVPDLAQRNVKEATRYLKQLGLKVVCHGRGVVYDQVPAAGAIVSRGDKIELTFGPEKRIGGSSGLMPMLTGLSLRDAVRKATESGLMVRIEGSGKVIKQSPRSGSRITVGGVCSIIAAG
ncbi:MAG: PASTA domain-containing protein, partial [Calditrichaeota bacterium]|nr:PASTA domain-containing protein [Calditrichota bacterium]